MARYTCPSCGASYNGKKCRACNYAHFSEEIAHGGHTHRGEPLVIDAPVRRPIPKKDPFDCEKTTRKSPFPKKREKKRRPFAGLLTIFLLIYSLLPLVRNWGLELEAREAAVLQPEMAVPEELVTLWEEDAVTISIQPHYLTNFAAGDPRIWVHNELEKVDISVQTRYVMVNGFVLPTSGLYVDAAGGLYGMGTLYLYEDELKDANIREVKELTFVLEAVDEDYNVLFVTDPITLSVDGRPFEPEWNVEGALTLLDEDGLYMESLGYWPGDQSPRYEDGSIVFYVENNTDRFLYMDSLETAIDGKPLSLFLWSGLPAGSRAVVRMELWPLEEWEITSPKELGDLTMTLEFWDPEDYDSFVWEYTVTMPMVREETLVIS